MCRYTHWAQLFTLVRGGCDNHRCHYKNPRWKWYWGANDVMPGSDGICPPSHQPDEYGTRPFLGWGQAQGRSLHAPGISKIASDPVGIPLKKGRHRRRAINPTPPKRVKAWGDGPPWGQRYIQWQDTSDLNRPSHYGRPNASHQLDTTPLERPRSDGLRFLVILKKSS